MRLLDNNDAILFIRGERPVIDQKYDIMKHPNVGLTEDGGAEPYVHGEAMKAAFTINLTTLSANKTFEATESDLEAAKEYILMAESDVIVETEEAKQNEQQKEK